MKFIVECAQLLKPLQQVNSLLGGRPTVPILGNLLLQVSEGSLTITGTNLEIEIVAQITLVYDHEPGVITVSARRFFDICRILFDNVNITVVQEGKKLLILSGCSRYSLSTLPASDFPNMKNWESKIEFAIPQSILKKLIESTQFSMANQDVRYYLNGMLFETEGNKLRTVATDGHRLSICEMFIDTDLPFNHIIIPRKGVIELGKMLDYNKNTIVKIQIGTSNIRAIIGNYAFTSKLIGGQFPNYRSIIPKNPDKMLEASCDMFKQACSRVAIISHEKVRGVRLCLSTNKLKITASNSEQDESEETIIVKYQGKEIEIGFNVNYLLDILNALKCENVCIMITDAISSVKITDISNQLVSYIVMPIRM